MISRKFQFTFLICIPLLWFFFKLLPVYTLPADCSTPNFIYPENIERLKIWCFDKHSDIRFDDSNNFLFISLMWVGMHFLKLTAVKAALWINGISVLLTVWLMQRTVDSRFSSIQLLLVGFVFLSVQVWTGVLGDEILFSGMLWLFVIHAFWKHRYFGIMVWGTIAIIAQVQNILLVLPLLVASYWDIKQYKERDRKRFWRRRISETVLFFMLPLGLFFFYRFAYFGKVLPFDWYHHQLESDRKYWIFDVEAWNVLKHYVRYFILPLVLGILFYFVKQRKKLNHKYYALFYAMILFPMLYNLTISQDENLGYKNFYSLYLGLSLLLLLFLRDFRSISMGFFAFIFVFFYGFKQSFHSFGKALQSHNQNMYYLSTDLAEIHDGSAIVYYDNFLGWNTDWKIYFANGKHSKVKEEMTLENMFNSDADILFLKEPILDYPENKFVGYSIPVNTMQYVKEAEPENSLDKFFYKYEHKVPLDTRMIPILLNKRSKRFDAIKKAIENRGAVLNN